MTLIEDFNDFNYENIAFDITGVDKDALRRRLKFDYVNHLWELDNANYIAIWNCDCQGFKREYDIYFDSDAVAYSLYKLIHKPSDNTWYYEYIGQRLVRYELRMR